MTRQGYQKLSETIRVAAMLTPKNFSRGFLVDEQLMGGVTHEGNERSYVAFVLNHLTGEYLFYHQFPDAETATHALNQIPRNWTYQAIHSCGSGSCGQSCAGCTNNSS